MYITTLKNIKRERQWCYFILKPRLRRVFVIVTTTKNTWKSRFEVYEVTLYFSLYAFHKMWPNSNLYEIILNLKPTLNYFKLQHFQNETRPLQWFPFSRIVYPFVITFSREPVLLKCMTHVPTRITFIYLF